MKQRAMRNGQNKRMRGRNRSKGQNPLTRVYESNGPDVKVRGTASHIAEKYIQLARDAQSSGDPVAAENYYQHAEHYFRLIAAVQEQFRQSAPFARDGESRDGFDEMEGDEQQLGTGEPYAPRDQTQQPSPSREARAYQPREVRFQPREQGQPYPPSGQQGQSEAGAEDTGEVDRLPAFVTGGASPSSAAPIAYAGNGHDGSAASDRFPLHRRRRRRHATPRGDAAGGEGGDQSGDAQGQGE